MGDNADFEHSIPNAWTAASPENPMFLVMVQEVIDSHNKIRESGEFRSAEGLTGPVALRNAIVRYERDKVLLGNSLDRNVAERVVQRPFAEQTEEHAVALLPSHFIYPYNWGDDGQPYRDVCWVLQDNFDAAECKRRLQVATPEGISITYWSHMHTPDGHSEDNMKNMEQ